MRPLAIAVFFLGLLFNFWFIRKAAQHRKDPNVPFYFGNADDVGRKYLWCGLLALLVAMIAVILVAKS